MGVSPVRVDGLVCFVGEKDRGCLGVGLLVGSLPLLLYGAACRLGISHLHQSVSQYLSNSKTSSREWTSSRNGGIFIGVSVKASVSVRTI